MIEGALAGFKMPVHDPPVAWRSGRYAGTIPLIVFPSCFYDEVPPLGVVTSVPSAIVVLPEKPGRRP